MGFGRYFTDSIEYAIFTDNKQSHTHTQQKQKITNNNNKFIIIFIVKECKGKNMSLMMTYYE